MTVKPLNDNVLIKVKKVSPEIVTHSGIVLRGVEHDYLVCEIADIGPGIWKFNNKTEKNEFITVDCEIGQVVVVEKNFYHEFDIERRDRVEDTISVPQLDDENFSYFLTKDKDIYLKFDSWEEADKFKVTGEFFKIAPPKAIKRIG